MTHSGLLDMNKAAVVDRKQELEARFCALLNDKANYRTQIKACEAEMYRIQGALAELERLTGAADALPH